MLFTVAPREVTDALFLERSKKKERVFKEGCSSRNKRGGAVWETREAAEAWLVSEEKRMRELFAADAESLKGALDGISGTCVYGVEAQVGRDTMQRDEEPFLRLIITRPMVQLGPRSIP